MMHPLSDPRAVAEWRSATQGLTAPRFEDAVDVVSFFAAVQAQEHGPAKWSLGLRTTGRTENEIEHAYAEGRILRTHALRPTWHYVTPRDLRWVQGLTAERVHRQNRTYYRRFGLDTLTRSRSREIILDSLKGGNHLTRPELREALSAAGIHAEGPRLAYIMMDSELEGLICSGRPRPQHTYALVDEWVAPAPSLDREEALARLTVAYFRSHGPATDRDFSWWSSLTLADVRAGLANAADELENVAIGDITYWWADQPPEVAKPGPEAHLIQTLDEYVIGYRDTRGVSDVDGNYRAAIGSAGLPYDPAIVDSQIVGRWRRKQTRTTYQVEIVPAFALAQRQRRALNDAGWSVARFFGLDLELTISDSPYRTL